MASPRTDRDNSGADHQTASRRENDRLFIDACDLGLRDDAPFLFLCECADPDCERTIRLTIPQYDEARRAAKPLLADGHRP